MKWPLSGIIAIVCLQLMFTAYNAVDRPIESLVAVNAITGGTNPDLGDLNAADDAYLSTDRPHRADIISALNRRSSVRSAEAFLTRRVVKVSVPESRLVKPQLVAMPKPFESIVITYPRSSKSRGEPENHAFLNKTAVLSDRRSLASKSVSIIKKPFDWVKALSSKL